MNTENLKKGISYVAFGFLFTLVNINLNFSSGTLNVTPDFIGWILLFLAFPLLGAYASDKPYLRWIPLLMVVLTGAVWILDFAKPELDAGILKTVSGVISAVYMFVLFGVLEQIARDYGSSRADTIRTLKYINLIAYAVMIVSFLITELTRNLSYGAFGLIVGFVGLAAAIVTLVVLLRFRKEMHTRIAERAADEAAASAEEENGSANEQ